MASPFTKKDGAEARRSLPAAIGIAVAGFYVAVEHGPVFEGTPEHGAVINGIPTFAAAACIANSCIAAAGVFQLTAGWLSLCIAKTPIGVKASGGWATWRDLIRSGDVWRYGFTAYWGVYAGKERRHRGKEIMADYESNSITFGTAGSGKGVGVILPTCLSIRASKLISDLKGTNSSMLAPPLKARNEEFFALNIGNQQTEILGESATYNPMHNLLDNLLEPNGILLLVANTVELSSQLYPKNGEPRGDEEFWRDGACNAIALAILQTLFVYGDEAHLGQVDLLLNDRQAFADNMLWASGKLPAEDDSFAPPMPLEDMPWCDRHDPDDLTQFIAWYRAKTSATADMLSGTENKTMESFLTGARQALAPFSQTSHACKVLSSSSFRFGEMKERPMTVAIVIDASRMETQKTVAALLQWCAFTEFKRHERKSAPVYIISDETTNFKIDNLPSLQTWGREYGIKWHGFVQSMSAYRTTYGKEALSVLLSETEIKQFLPGQREPEILDLISKLLGGEPIITESANANRREYGISGRGFSEAERPLMTADEIRRTKKTILFIRHHRPILTHLPPIAAIHPWRKQIGNNPFYKKRWLLPITLRISKRQPSVLRKCIFRIFGR